jgi:uncharacterized protein YodC (DUF2158 family)
MSLEAGQVVQLKSGGPLMTIGSVNDEEKAAFCLWFDEATLMKEIFPLVVLEVAELFLDDEDDDLDEDEDDDEDEYEEEQ